jgi:hypothetical protein
MKLAQALLLRSDNQKKIESLRERIVGNALVQDGDKPDEEPSELLPQALATIAEQEQLMVAIHQANATHLLPDGRSLIQAMMRRNTLVAQHALLVAAGKAARKETDRYSSREIKWQSALDVVRLQKQTDTISQQIRDINALIQEVNWQASVPLNWPGDQPA